MPSREPLRRSEADLSNLDIIDSIAYAIREQSYEMDKTAGIKDKLLSMVGAQKKPSLAASLGKGAIAAGTGAGVFALLQKLLKNQSYGEQLKSVPAATAKAAEQAIQKKMGDTPESLLDELREWGVMGADRA